MEIKKQKDNLFKVEVRASDEDLDISFFVDYDTVELEGEKWVEKAKNFFLDIKNKSKSKENIEKNFVEEKGLIKYKVINEEKSKVE